MLTFRRLAEARPPGHRSSNRSVSAAAGRTMSLRRSVAWAGLLAVLLLVFASGAPSTAGAASEPPVGNADLEPNVDHDDARTPEAFQYLATDSATIRSLTVFLDGSSEATGV